MPIVFTVLTIFAITVVVVLTISFILYKMKNKNSVLIGSRETFSLPGNTNLPGYEINPDEHFIIPIQRGNEISNLINNAQPEVYSFREKMQKSSQRENASRFKVLKLYELDRVQQPIRSFYSEQTFTPREFNIYNYYDANINTSGMRKVYSH